MNKKKAAGITGGAAAVITAIIVAVSGGSQNVDITYSIEPKNEYVTIMNIDTPENKSIDIATLYLNGTEVDKTVLPNGHFESIPVAFEDLSRLEVKLYRLDECVGTVKLDEAKAVDEDA